MTADAVVEGSAVVPDAEPSACDTLPRLPGVGAAAAAQFQRLYETEFRELSGYCRALLGDDHLALDCAQEAFTRLFARWRSVREPRAFLFFVATNLARDEWRREARGRRLAERLAIEPERVVPAADAAVADLVERLPDRHREVVLLHYFADLSVEDIARLTHRPVGTVKRRLHEARRLLSSAWEDNR